MADVDWKCTECGGTGMAVPDCETCAGNGWVDDPDDGGTMTCPDCLGDKCEACGGSGERAERVTTADRGSE